LVHIAKDKALRLITNQSVPTPQAIGIIFGLGTANFWITQFINIMPLYGLTK
jgi:hypothetical protein